MECEDARPRYGVHVSDAAAPGIGAGATRLRQGPKCTDGSSVVGRALCQGGTIGSVMGALAGAVVAAEMFAEAVSGPPWYQEIFTDLAAYMVFTAIGALVGGFVGIGFALPPAIVLALERRYFRRHLGAAAVCTCLVGFPAALYLLYLGCEASELFVFAIPMALGVALATRCARYVVTGTGFRLCDLRG